MLGEVLGIQNFSQAVKYIVAYNWIYLYFPNLWTILIYVSYMKQMVSPSSEEMKMKVTSNQHI